MADHRDAPDPIWRPVSAWADLLPAGRAGQTEAPAGLIVADGSCELATLVAHAGAAGPISTRLATAFGVVPPATPRIVTGAQFDMIWSGRDRWLARSARPGLAARLAASLGDMAAVTDQSASRAVLRVAGPQVRSVLAKGCMLDLHPGVFKPGDAALTAIAHMDVQIWRGTLDGDDLFEIAVGRSVAGSFWSWLAASAAEFGCESGTITAGPPVSEG